MRKKEHIEIPKDIAARVLFISNRTCCVCRGEGKPVQIHHIDDNPSNNAFNNLAVLCFDCHRETQIKGGFDRKLDGDQVCLYRDDWYALVNQRRATNRQETAKTDQMEGMSAVISTSIAEIYRDNKEYELLAIHYGAIGNSELRNKYVELALKDKPSDSSVCFLRGLQERPDLIPPDVLKRELRRFAKHKDYSQRGRLLLTIGQTKEAAIDYLRGILEFLKDDNAFSAAYYLKEMSKDGLVEQLFILELNRAKEAKDLWWQIRALQELDWDEDLNKLLLGHQDEIRASEDPELQRLLAVALGDAEKMLECQKQIAQSTHAEGDGVVSMSNTLDCQKPGER